MTDTPQLLLAHHLKALKLPTFLREYEKEALCINMRVQHGPFRLDRVIEKLATSDKVTLTAERLLEGKMRVTSNSFADEKVLAPDHVLEVRNVSGRLHVARKERHPDEWDRMGRPDRAL